MSRMNARDQFLANIAKGYGKTLTASRLANQALRAKASAAKLLQLGEDEAPAISDNDDGSVTIELPTGRYMSLFPSAQPTSQDEDGNFLFPVEPAGTHILKVPAVAERRNKDDEITQEAVEASEIETDVFVTARFTAPVLD